jgi:hypothetical protein
MAGILLVLVLVLALVLVLVLALAPSVKLECPHLLSALLLSP